MNSRLRFGLLLPMLIALLSGPVAAAERAPTAKHNELTPAEIAAGWLLLFDGHSTFGWTATSNADWTVADGVLSVRSGDKGLLCTSVDFADYIFKADFRATKDTNSGIFLRTPTSPQDPALDCYELNIAQPHVSPFPTGSFVQREKSVLQAFDEDWHTFEVLVFQRYLFVKIDDLLILEYVDKDPIRRGLIGLQFNEGMVEFRNVKLKPLGLQNIFNGRDLSGWKVFPDKASVFSVTEGGELNVKNGPGQLESEARFGDFVLQLDVFSNGAGLNSGIFFRSIPGEFSNGYESQIQNSYKDGDRTKPVDFGTGAIYRRQPARKVVSNDFEWFTKTVVATGSNIATWVNGYPVIAWTDTRKPNKNPRAGLRTEAGTLIIQGHDPTTDLSFRNLRAAELPTE